MPAEAHVEVPVAPERAYAAWVEPERLAQWFRPHPNAHCEVLKLEPRPGGRWEVAVEAHDGAYRVGGTYVELLPHRRLVFSWRWIAGGPTGFDDETTVHVDFVATQKGTRINVVHERLPPPLAGMHREGWERALALLSTEATR